MILPSQKRLSAVVRKIQDLVISQVERDAWSGAAADELNRLGEQVLTGKLTPQAAAKKVLSNLKLGKK